MLATLPLLLAGGVAAVRGWVLAFHVMAVAALYLVWRHPATGWMRVAGDWLPLLLLPALYAELPFLMQPAADGSVPFRDATVLAWEAGLFGGLPARSLAGALPFTWLSELLHFGYLSYYAIVFAPPALLYLRGRQDAFAASAAAVMASFALCFLVFALWPVEGPRYRYPAPDGIADGPVRSLVLFILERGSSRGAAFPSSHAAAAVAQAVVLLRVWPALGGAVAGLTALLLVGAVYGGFHYAIDMVAGTGLGLAVAAVALRLLAPRAQERTTAPGRLVTPRPAGRFGVGQPGPRASE